MLEKKAAGRLLGQLSRAAFRAALVVVLAGVVAAVIFRSEQVIGITGLLVAGLTLALEAWSFSGRKEVSEPSPQAQADDLAQAVQAEWLEEAHARRLQDPGLLPLTWKQAARHVMDNPQELGGGQVLRLRLGGRVDETPARAGLALAAAYQQIPGGRLVVLGEPGAGKTVLALMLTLGLVEARNSGKPEPVPVLLSASSWDPIAQSFDEWLVRQLGNSYYNGRTETAARLVRHGLVLPVLDGLDEIPEAQRRSAIMAINRALRSDRPIVVTCRAVEYADLITGGAPVLRRAPVVEVLPLAASDTIRYLGSVEWPAGTDWESVLEVLHRDPGAPVAQALTTPLMVSLARLVYERLGGDPGLLLTTEGLDSRHAVEDFLTDRVVDAAAAPDDGGPPDADEAVRLRRWLTFLAEYLHQHRERDFTWWQLSQRVLSPWVAPALGIGGGAGLMIAVAAWITVVGGRPRPSLDATIMVSAAVGGAFAVLLTLVWYAAMGRGPGRVAFTLVGSRSRLSRGFRHGFLAALLPVGTVLLGLAATLTVSRAWRLENIERYLEGVVTGLALCAVTGLGVALHSWVDAPPRSAARAAPLDFLRQDRRSSWVGATVAGLVVGACVLPAVVVGAVTGSVISKWSSNWAGWPDAGYGQLAAAVTHDVTVGLFFSPMLLVGGAVVLPALVLASLVFLSRAWPRFVLARVVLAARGRLPWRFPGFLVEARDRGLLRQSGGAYQFRHVRLQEHLANHALTHPGPGPSRVVRARVRRALLTAAAACLLVVVALLRSVPQDVSDATLIGSHDAGPFSVIVSPDGRFVLGAGPGQERATVWDLRSPGSRRALPIDADDLATCRFSPDGRLLVHTAGLGTDSVGRTEVWDLDTLARLVDRAYLVAFPAGTDTMLVGRSPAEQRPPARSASRRGRAVETAKKRRSLGSVEVWNLRALQRVGAPLAERYLNDEKGSRFVTTTLANRTELRNSVSGEVIRDLGVVPEIGAGVTLTSDTGVIMAEGRRQTWLWSARTGRKAGTVPAGGPGWAVSPDGRYLASTSGGTDSNWHNDVEATIWDSSTGRAVYRASYPLGFINQVKFSPDGKWATLQANATDGSWNLWLIDVTRGARIMTFTGDEGRFAPASGATKVLLTATYEERLEAWDLSRRRAAYIRTGSPIGLEEGQYPRAGGFSADGRVALIPKAGRVTVIETVTGKVLLSLANLPEKDSFATLSPDGRVVLTVQPSGVRLWETRTGRLARTLAAAPGDLRRSKDEKEGMESPAPHTAGRSDDNGYWGSAPGSVAGDVWSRPVTAESNYLFSADGRWLLTAAQGSETAQVWDTRTTRPAMTLTGHGGAVHAIGFLPDSRHALTVGASDDTVRVWNLPSR